MNPGVQGEFLGGAVPHLQGGLRGFFLLASLGGLEALQAAPCKLVSGQGSPALWVESGKNVSKLEIKLKIQLEIRLEIKLGIKLKRGKEK